MLRCWCCLNVCNAALGKGATNLAGVVKLHANFHVSWLCKVLGSKLLDDDEDETHTSEPKGVNEKHIKP